MQKAIFALILLSLILLSGCAQVQDKPEEQLYLCPDKRVVKDPAECAPQPEKKKISEQVVAKVQVVAPEEEKVEEEKTAEPLEKVRVTNFCNLGSANCIVYFNGIDKKIRQTYLDGIEMQYKYFSLATNIDAENAFAAALCAGDQGKFFEFYMLVKDNRKNMQENHFKLYASELELNRTLFDTCLLGKKYKPEIQANIDEGKKLKISLVPTTFIGGRAVFGHEDFNPYKNAIDTEIARLKAASRIIK